MIRIFRLGDGAVADVTRVVTLVRDHFYNSFLYGAFFNIIVRNYASFCKSLSTAVCGVIYPSA
jgi:hypothetical protein